MIYLITVRSIGHSRTVGSQHGNSYMSSFKRLPFGDGSYISGKFVRPCLSRITSYCTANINAILCSRQCIIVLQDFQSRTPIYTVKSVENGKRTEQKRLSPTTHKQDWYNIISNKLKNQTQVREKEKYPGPWLF